MNSLRLLLLAGLLVISAVIRADTIGTAFTYQGELVHLGQVADGTFDFQFDLYAVQEEGSTLTSPIQLEDVTVSNGIFSVSLDFGLSPFTGQSLWLQIGVSPDTGDVDYTMLAPRQNLTATPYAVHASTVSEGSITAASIAEGNVGSTQIADFSITSIDIANSAITQAKLAENSVGSPQLIDQSVSTDDLALNSVGSGQIDTSQVQARVGGTCLPGSAVTGINPDGSVVCGKFPVQPFDYILDYDWVFLGASGFGYSNLSIALNPEGNPSIGFHSSYEYAIETCESQFCEPRVIYLGIVEYLAEGFGTSDMVVGNDGKPVITYYDRIDNDLRIVKCNRPACTLSDLTVTTVDLVNAGTNLTIELGDDGYPVILYEDESDHFLMKCNDVACSGNDESVEALPNSSPNPGMTIGADGNPVIVYRDSPGDVVVMKCNDPACAGNDESISVVDERADLPANSVFSLNSIYSIAIGNDGFPIISYDYVTENRYNYLKVAKCNDAACAGNDETISSLITPTIFGLFSKILVLGDGIPAIGHKHNGAIAVTRCGNSACSDGNETLTYIRHFIANFSLSGWDMTVGADGFPLLVYYDNLAKHLRMVHCRTYSCQ